ncbi:MAG: DUF192 domain-containing protein [Candidatus Woesearchaeota archaeon]|nr:DUF192 domain-containing protein [Candidatus Woesearchaeota archaeon]MDP7505953.1 DUF192 domain-containing protein [Candidatus Woesearchaeota archaeon]MDP7610221.1 DUF192 domain-containing protein [Candidatus Woesearchaeota archaeon]
MIVNKTKRIIISEKEKCCKSIFSKAKGLMFSRRMWRPLVFFFDREQKVSIHMFFVFFPIDVVYLDESRKVVCVKENVKPFRVVEPVNCRYIVELAENSVKKYKIEKEDMIGF